MEHYYKSVVGWFDFQDIYTEMVGRATDGDIFIETGTANGRSAAYMCVEIVNSEKKINFKTVDCFFAANVNQEKNARAHLEQFDFCEVIKSDAIEFLKSLPDESVNFIFLDDKHTEEHLYEQLKIVWRKLKNGGFVGGHDYLNRGYPGVKRAVDDFAKDNGINVRVCNFSFLIQKLILSK